MENQQPTPASAKENDTKKQAEEAARQLRRDEPKERDGKNDSGVEPEIHGHELPGE